MKSEKEPPTIQLEVRQLNSPPPVGTLYYVVISVHEYADLYGKETDWAGNVIKCAIWGEKGHKIVEWS